jgi:hypothetical protein
VETGDFDFAGVDGFEDAREKTDADAMAKFGIFEPEVANLQEHCPSVGVAMRVPTSRQ